MNEKKIRELAEKTGTPAYIFDTDLFRERAELVKRAFGEKTGLCFSIKANAFLLKRLPAVFDHIEVCSPGELTICEKLGMDMAKVIYSGVNKGAEDVRRAAEDGVGTFTAESMRHLTLIDEEGKRLGKEFPVLLRLSGGSQFGIDEEELIHILKSRSAFKGVRIEGLHFFTGTQKRKPAVIEKELDRLDAFCGRALRETGLAIKRLEYGTGLAVDYFREDADKTEEERLLAVSGKIREMAAKYDLTIEMGRFFAAPAGFYLSSVCDRKRNDGVNYLILDGGLHQLKYDGQLQGMQIPVITHLRSSEREGDATKWTLAGSLCTTQDILAREVPLVSPKAGDILAFGRTGAYSAMEGMAIFLSRDLPLIALYSEEEGLEIVRKPIKADIFNTAGEQF